MGEFSGHGIGVAVADPEIRNAGTNGTKVCVVNLAFNRSYQDNKTKEWKTETCFLRANVWGAKAEKMAATVKKGTVVYVTGYVKQDQWQADDGQKRIAYNIVARDFQVCVKNTKDNNASQSQPPQQQSVPSIETSNADNDDVPF